MTNPLTLASRAKGPLAMLRRGRAIGRRYGLTPARFIRALQRFTHTLDEHHCGASFPLTAIALQRNPVRLLDYLDHNIEFPVHGYVHVDYSKLDSDLLLDHLLRAREIFSQAGMPADGFRTPYLRRAPHLHEALEKAGFSYASNQPILFALPPDHDRRLLASEGYRRALDFYAPWDAGKRPSLPRRTGSLVEIPVALPDDEMLLDRQPGRSGDLVRAIWSHILSETHKSGELFTLQLHPERIDFCVDALSAILAAARDLRPAVWLARLDRIAAWWRARAEANVEVRSIAEDTWQISGDGPRGTTLLVRGGQPRGPAEPWTGGYWIVRGTSCAVRADSPPFLGVSPRSNPALLAFLQEQGYVFRIGKPDPSLRVYLDRPAFGPEDERALLQGIDRSSAPLVRLGRWPDGARSALCITGDIDALTIWDYALRALGR